jgi:hypothetical protein
MIDERALSHELNRQTPRNSARCFGGHQLMRSERYGFTLAMRVTSGFMRLLRKRPPRAVFASRRVTSSCFMESWAANVCAFWFDWRKDLCQSAADLNQFLIGWLGKIDIETSCGQKETQAMQESRMMWMLLKSTEASR